MRWRARRQRERSPEQQLTASYGALELSGGALRLGEPRWRLSEPGVRLDPAGVTGWNSTGSETTPWAKVSSAEVTLAEPRPGRTARSLWSGFKLLVWGLLTAGSDGWFPDVGAGGDVDLIAVELMVSRWPRIVVAMPNWDEPLSELERYAPQRVMDVLIRTPAARGHLGSPLRLRAVLTDLQARGSAADIDARLLAWAADAG